MDDHLLNYDGYYYCCRQRAHAHQSRETSEDERCCMNHIYMYIYTYVSYVQTQCTYTYTYVNDILPGWRTRTTKITPHTDMLTVFVRGPQLDDYSINPKRMKILSVSRRLSLVRGSQEKMSIYIYIAMDTETDAS